MPHKTVKFYLLMLMLMLHENCEVLSVIKTRCMLVADGTSSSLAMVSVPPPALANSPATL